MVADDTPDVGGAGVGGPSDPRVARPQLPGRRAEADTAEDAVALRPDPVAQLPAEAAPIPEDDEPPSSPPTAGGRRRRPPDRARPGRGPPVRRPAGCRERLRPGQREQRSDPAPRGPRKIEPDALRKRRQRLRRRRQAQAAEGVAPAGALAQFAGQGVAREAAGTQGTGEPVKRQRIEMAETNLHAPRLNDIDYLYKWIIERLRAGRIALTRRAIEFLAMIVEGLAEEETLQKTCCAQHFRNRCSSISC